METGTGKLTVTVFPWVFGSKAMSNITSHLRERYDIQFQRKDVKRIDCLITETASHDHDGLRGKTFHLGYGKTRSVGASRGCSREFKLLSSPIFNEALKTGPTGIKPPNLWAATAAKPIEAMHPQELQFGLPPNWQGVILVLRSAEIV